MNITTPSEVLSLISEIRDLNLKEKIANESQVKDWDDPMLAYEMSTNELVILFERILNQFEERFHKNDAAFLPNHVSFKEQEDYRFNEDYTLTSKLKEAISCIKNKDLYTLSNVVRWLINYQMVFNFWNNSETKLHDVDTTELLAKTVQVDNILVQIKKLKKEFEEISKLHSEAIDSLTDFQKTKDAELKTISNSLKTVTNQSEEVSSVWANVTKLNSDITSVYNLSKSQIDEVKTQMEKQDEKFNLKIDEISELEKKIKDDAKHSETIFEQFSEKLAYITSTETFINDKEREITKLTGFAADGSLGFTFNKRKEELRKASNNWFIAIPIVSIIVLVWILIVFNFLASDSGTAWISTLINSIKTLPAILLLFFVIKQYNKERNLQEEYAFKATVAMTIKAYADQIQGEQDGDRRKMLMDSINKIFSSPKINNDSNSIISFRTKSLTDSIKDLTEITNNLSKVITK